MKIFTKTALTATLSTAACFAIATTSSADFERIEPNAYITSNSAGDFVITDLYACFDSPENEVVNIYNVNGGLLDGSIFYQAEQPPLLPESWAPNAFNQLTPGEDVPDAFIADSFVTIGDPDDPSNNTTALDPNFTPPDAPGPLLPQNAGWFTSNPPNNQGIADDDNPFDSDSFYTFIGRFSVEFGCASYLAFSEISISYIQNEQVYQTTDSLSIIGVSFPCPADLNEDAVVDGSDLGTLLGAWGETNFRFDLTGDGIIDGADLGILLGDWGECCPGANP